MTTVIALANQKGGVGKTTTAINLGAAVAARDKRVLIIDLDPQANATSGLGLRPDDEASMYQVLMGQKTLTDVILATASERLFVVPSSPDLAGAEVELAAMMAREYRLKRAMETGLESFDIVFIDCPPSLGLLTVNGLAAADEVIVPVQCEYLALEGLGQLTHTLDLVRRNLNTRLELRGLLLTMYDKRTSLSQQVAEEVRRHFANTFHAIIPRNVRVSEAPSHGVPINVYDPRSPAALAYDEAAEELLADARRKAEVAS
ncbi:MAG: AAA family ATPase [Dehalococcoidia bacterium]